MFGSNIPPGCHTLGRDVHPGFYVPLSYTASDIFTDNPDAKSRFRLILVQRGTGILQLGESRQSFIAPTLFCLNERESIHLERSHDLQAQALYFFPSIINHIFNFENIRDWHEHFVGTAFQDLELLDAFTHRNGHYKGQLLITATSAQRLATLFNAVGQELAQQNNNYWPCRSRSFLLEALTMIFRIFSAPQDKTLVGRDLRTASEEIDSIILYLHTNYPEKLTVEGLSKAFHTNRTTLETHFRLATGMPLMAYLIQLRIRIAVTMLHDTTLPISEIAVRVGFKDSTHFGRMFRKYIGRSPLEYRQSYCWLLQ